MSVMIVVQCEMGSNNAVVVCPVCGKSSTQMLLDRYACKKTDLLWPHTCSVCGAAYKSCIPSNGLSWSAAYARYTANPEEYEASAEKKPVQSIPQDNAPVKTYQSKPASTPLLPLLKSHGGAALLPAPVVSPAISPAAPQEDAAAQALDRKLEHWKKELLDTSKRNRLINYRETRRSTLRILEPGAEELFNKLAFSEKSLTFQRPISKDTDFRTFAMLSLLETMNYSLPVSVGDIKTSGTAFDREKALKNMRTKAKLAREEQGAHILYLAFGFIEWREKNRANAPWMRAPVLLMPVSLGLKNLNAPYTLSRDDDEVEVNPTLGYLFKTEYGLELPAFKLKTRRSFGEYMDAVEQLADQHNWRLVRDVGLGLLSFQKISMYHDLNDNRDRILANPVLRAIAGDKDALGPLPVEASYGNLCKVDPRKRHTVVDSDSSQDQAIQLSKLGVSFVMEGPPGSGKSQTITNIIAEALADGKKVLFVSEKSAALQVVLKRLTEAHLDDFCLSLHNYKANKKEIIANIGANLDLQPEYDDPSVLTELTDLFYNNSFLDQYAAELHTVIDPLGDSIYVVYGKLSNLESASVVEFTVDHPAEITKQQYASMLYCISAFEKALQNLDGPLTANPWYGTNAIASGQSFKAQFIAATGLLDETLGRLENTLEAISQNCRASLVGSWTSLEYKLARLQKAAELPYFPHTLYTPEAITQAMRIAGKEYEKQQNYLYSQNTGRAIFSREILSAPLAEWADEARNAKTKLARSGAGKVPEDAAHAVEELDTLCTDLKCFAVEYRKLAENLGLPADESIARAGTLIQSIETLQTAPIGVLESWFDTEMRKQALSVVQQAMESTQSYSEQHDAIVQQWDESVLRLDWPTLRRHFCSEYIVLFAQREGDALAESIAKRLQCAEHLRDEIHLLTAALEEAATLLGLVPEYTMQQMELAANVLEDADRAATLEPKWFDIRRNGDYLILAQDAKEHADQIAQLRRTILADWEASAFSVDARSMLGRFKTEYIGLLYPLSTAYQQDMRIMRSLSKKIGERIERSEIIALLQNVDKMHQTLEWFTENNHRLCAMFGSLYAGPGTDWDKLCTGIACAGSIAQQFPFGSIPTDTIRALQQILADISRSASARRLAHTFTAERLHVLRQQLDVIFHWDRIDDCTPLTGLMMVHLDSFICDWTVQQQFLPLLAQAAGKRQIRYADILELAEQTGQLDTIREWFECNDALHTALFDNAYRGMETDWAKLQTVLQSIDALAAHFEQNAVPAPLAQALCSGRADLTFCADKPMTEWCAELKQRIRAAAPWFDLQNSTVAGKLLPQLQEYRAALGSIHALLERLRPYCLNNYDTDTVLDALEQTAALRAQCTELEQNSPSLSALFGKRYQGADTDWNAILMDLETVHSYLATPETLRGAECGEVLGCEPEAREQLRLQLDTAGELYRMAADGVAYFASLFPSEDVRELDVSQLRRRYLACRENFGQLSKWLDYTQAKAECDQMGLDAFTNAIAKSDNAIPDITAAFERDFYTQWLSCVVDDLPAVQTFRRRVHDRRLAAFIAQDEKQSALASSQIRTKLIRAFPQEDSAAHLGTELSALRHELEKQRRIMPLRQLFRKIPNLLLTLKPCLMMSPLSVAQFLASDAYRFDMVIFDEASQIFPQDAVGAILRAKQVIIAGDTRQLPPTNFFSATTGNAEDYDDFAEEYEEEVYDSILEETATVLPNRTLLWHYRSRHEHLIAFSNRHIYRNKLITFPSCIENEPDTGVEFVYEPEGFYEGGGRNCNIPEAKRCVELIREHIERHPERSLGIIAFSEKQQQAIAHEVQRFREENPQHEAFFAEGKEGEFFIKNLENVQGDERDTIFFSVGYAKTREQKQAGRPMAMRFGPLGAQGGERRLNVAITRARINIKLVSSILPGDIDLDKTDSEGIRMLRSYLEFARTGNAALAGSHTPKRTDAFADAVCSFIQNSGYKTRQYVGCSGYKLDIVVEHPAQENRFVAAVECDGYSYASAKTARDRDRLRGSVLRGMGWKLYRVWSAEWNRDPETEQRKLLEFIERSLAECREMTTEDGHEDVPAKTADKE